MTMMNKIVGSRRAVGQSVSQTAHLPGLYLGEWSWKNPSMSPMDESKSMSGRCGGKCLVDGRGQRSEVRMGRLVADLEEHPPCPPPKKKLR